MFSVPRELGHAICLDWKHWPPDLNLLYYWKESKLLQWRLRGVMLQSHTWGELRRETSWSICLLCWRMRWDRQICGGSSKSYSLILSFIIKMFKKNEGTCFVVNINQCTWQKMSPLIWHVLSQLKRLGRLPWLTFLQKPWYLNYWALSQQWRLLKGLVLYNIWFAPHLHPDF